MQLQTNLSNVTFTTTARKTQRPDPSGFVLSIGLTLFTLTLIAVLTMNLAMRFGWQIL